MVKDEAKKLETLAKAVHLCCEPNRHYGRDYWHEIVVDAGLGIDRRTADSYYRLARIRGLIHEQRQWWWCKGRELERFLPNLRDQKSESEIHKKEAR